MAKINATFGAGYYVDPSVSYTLVESSRRREEKQSRKGPPVVRQTFAAPFTLQCDHCNAVTARGTHHYANRRKAAESYLGLALWELQIKCRNCSHDMTLITDRETAKLTGGYKCLRGCTRPAGDFLTRNEENAKVQEELAANKLNEERGALGDVHALAAHNERVERIHALNQAIEDRLATARALDALDGALPSEASDPPANAASLSLLDLSDRDQPAATHSGRTRVLLEEVQRRKRQRELDDALGSEVTDDAAAGEQDDELAFRAFQQAVNDNDTSQGDRDHTASNDAPLDLGSLVGSTAALQGANPFDVVVSWDAPTQAMPSHPKSTGREGDVTQRRHKKRNLLSKFEDDDEPKT